MSECHPSNKSNFVFTADVIIYGETSLVIFAFGNSEIQNKKNYCYQSERKIPVAHEMRDELLHAAILDQNSDEAAD